MNPDHFKIKGKVLYEGNKEYLPRTIAEEAGSDSLFLYQYTYTVVYGRDHMHQAIPLFNPLTLVGFPIGEDTLMISGKLEIVREKEVLKSYTATCGFNKSRNIFSEGETFSELRRRGLLTVRDNIETQMGQDKEFLLTLKPPD